MGIRHALRPFAAIVTVASLSLPIVACTGTGDDVASTTTGERQRTSLVMTDEWVKAAPRHDHMSALFGTLANDGDGEIRVVSGSTPVAEKVEMHETVEQNGQTVMREMAGGFVVPAHGRLDLKPGESHIMLMGLKQTIKAGETITVELRTADGAALTVKAIARDFAGNQEKYQP